jgi:aldose sugar dehydrogenase
MDRTMTAGSGRWRSPLAAGLAALAACAQAPGDARGQVERADPPPSMAAEPGAVEPRLVTVATGLEHPWGVAFLPGGDLLVTERPGRLRLIRDGRLVAEPLAGIPEVWARGQGGLMDVALHPGFAENRLVYLSYSKPGPRGATTAIARGRLEEGRLAEVRDVFVAEAWGTRGQHFGSRIVFDRDGFLYLSIGDRGEMQRAQDRSDHAGSVLRLHDDGRVPADNPFVGRSGVRPEIFSYGNRNIQGMAIHPRTGELWAVEHGARGGDEINVIRAGANYGWPAITHGVDYSGRAITPDTARPGMEQPLHHWTPSIAVAGMTLYDGNAFPGWRGNLLAAALAGQHVARVELDGERVVREERLFGDLGHRFRQVQTAPDGTLILLVDAADAPVLRVEPSR